MNALEGLALPLRVPRGGQFRAPGERFPGVRSADVSARATAFAWRGALLTGLLGGACGTVDPGADFQFASVVYDQNYFYCRVEPVLFSQNCGPGDASESGGCHFNVTPFRLTQHDPIPCNGSVPTGRIPAEAQDNYAAASRQMSPDPDQADLLNRPLKKERHPRQIFDENSPEADVIRAWATQFTSR